MSQLSSVNKYNVAWFKLYEFINRREKEKALGIYRLLVHSIDNNALALKLEGDIYLSFNDVENALNSYIKSANIYYDNKNYIEFATIYEHINLLFPENIDYIINICIAYLEIDIKPKLYYFLNILLDKIIKNNSLDKLDFIITKNIINKNFQYTVYEYFLINISKNENLINCYRNSLYRYIEIFVNLSLENNKNLDKFLSELELINTNIFEYTFNLIK